MIKKLTISGASDDLIEIEGDIRDEYYANCEGTNYLAFSDGTCLKLTYESGGCWRIYILSMNAKIIEHFIATDPDGTEPNDRLTIEGDIKWLVCGKGKIIK